MERPTRLILPYNSIYSSYNYTVGTSSKAKSKRYTEGTVIYNLDLYTLYTTTKNLKQLTN